MAKVMDLVERVDAALAAPPVRQRDAANANSPKQRAELVRALATAEEEWLTLS